MSEILLAIKDMDKIVNHVAAYLNKSKADKFIKIAALTHLANTYTDKLTESDFETYEKKPRKVKKK